MGFHDDMRRLQQMSGSLPASARIVGLRREGDPILGVVELELELEVSVRGARPYVATHRELVDTATAAGLEPGTTVPVLIGPGRSVTLASL